MHWELKLRSHVEGGRVVLGVGARAPLSISRLAQPIPAPAGRAHPHKEDSLHTLHTL